MKPDKLLITCMLDKVHTLLVMNAGEIFIIIIIIMIMMISVSYLNTDGIYHSVC